MTPAEKKLAAELLKECSGHYGNHTCNDYALPNTPDNMAMMQAAVKWNAPNGPEYEWDILVSKEKTEIYASDFFLMGYLAHVLESEAK